MLVCEDSAVYELLHLVKVAAESSQCVAGSVLCMSYDAQKEVVGSYSIASRPHRFFARVVDYRIEFVRYAYFHNVFTNDCTNLLIFS